MGSDRRAQGFIATMNAGAAGGRFRRLSIYVVAVLLPLGCGDVAPPRQSAVVPLASPAGPGSSEPHLATAADGTTVLSWIYSEDGSPAQLRFATYRGELWSAPTTVSSGADWFINWADFPSVEPIDGNLWAAHWLVKKSGGIYSYDVAIALSTDAGQSWSSAITPHLDGTRTEHGFVSLFPWQSGIGAIWLDGRNMPEEDPNETGGHGHNGAMSLRSAVIQPDGTIAAGQEIDSLVCDCCQTDVAVGPNGPVAVYRDRTETEIRDISVTRSPNGIWSPPVTLGVDNWEIGGCPVNGPAIAARDNNMVVVWFTATAERATRVKAAYSRDAGETFSDEILIDDQRPMGRVDAVVLPGGDAVVSWLRRGGEGRAELLVRRVSPSGELGPELLVTETAASRPSGFPQMSLAGDDHLILAWPDTSGEQLQIRTARAMLN